MSKERLEVIKEEYDIQVMQTFSDRETVPFNLNDIRWLIEQAERVQELENANRVLKKANVGSERGKERLRKWVDELEMENERYREALEFYAEGKHATGYGAVARKALEGEE